MTNNTKHTPDLIVCRSCGAPHGSVSENTPVCSICIGHQQREAKRRRDAEELLWIRRQSREFRKACELEMAREVLRNARVP